jgi:hypothetical protein
MQPKSLTMPDANTAVFSVVAENADNVSYRWQQSADGGSWSDISEDVSSTFRVAALTAQDNGWSRFRCVLTNAGGSTPSDPAVLTVVTVVYVQRNACGANDGKSWGSAFAELLDALQGIHLRLPDCWRSLLESIPRGRSAPQLNDRKGATSGRGASAPTPKGLKNGFDGYLREPPMREPSIPRISCLPTWLPTARAAPPDRDGRMVSVQERAAAGRFFREGALSSACLVSAAFSLSFS